MSNTYFKLSKQTIDSYNGTNYTTDMKLTLTAFMGGQTGSHTQIAIQTNSNIPNQGSTGYIVLNDNDVDLLIAVLLERKLKKISATGYEESIFSPEKPD